MTLRSPIPGAVRITKLAPAGTEEGPVSYVAKHMEGRGWTFHAETADVSGEGYYSPYVLVTAWATPPKREVANDG
jgi:hypothetical protein